MDEETAAQERADGGEERGRRLSSTPRWVIVTGVLVLVAIAVLIIVMLAGGDHGPGRHM